MSAISGFSFSKTLLAQTGSISGTLFTPSADGDYVATLYIENLSGHNNVSGSISWVDDTGTRTFSSTSGNVLSDNSGGVASAHIKSGNAVTYAATDSGESLSYNVFITFSSVPTCS